MRCLSRLVLHFCALFVHFVSLLMCVEYGGIFELVFITVIDDLMQNWRVENEVAWQRLLAVRFQYLLNVLLLRLLAPQFLLDLVLGELNSVLVSFVGRSRTEYLERLLIVDGLWIRHLKLVLVLVLMHLGRWSRSGSVLCLEVLRVWTDHLVVQQEFLALRHWTTLCRCLFPLLKKPQDQLFAVFLCFERLVVRLES